MELRKINLAGVDVPAEILVILDRSGSMGHIKDDVIGGFNQFVEEQRAEPGDARLTLVQFDDMYEVQLAAVPLAEVPALTRETFQPRGGTAINDTVVRAIRELKERLDGKDTPRIVVVIMTDGGENASRKFSRQDAFEEIRSVREAGGLVLFIGANQDAIREGESLGVGAAQSVNFSAGAIGTNAVYASAARLTRSYRGASDIVMGASMGFDAGDRASAMGDDPSAAAATPREIAKALGNLKDQK